MKGSRTKDKDKANVINDCWNDPYSKYGWYDSWRNWMIATNLNIINLANKKIRDFLKNKETIIRNDIELSEFKQVIFQSNKMIDDLCGIYDRIIRPKLRFKILKRDKFTCQYCWRKSPKVELQIDHIIPFSKWWTTQEHNLIVSCRDCNIWKSNIPLWE